MGFPLYSMERRTDNKTYRIQTPQKPIVQNRRHEEYQMDEYPMGTNAILACVSYSGYDMEDACIVNKSSYERGFAHASIYKTLLVDFGGSGMSSNADANMRFSNVKPGCKPKGGGDTSHLVTPKLDEDGLPRVGEAVQYGDPVWCAIDGVTLKERIGKHKEKEPAIIDQVRVLGPPGDSKSKDDGIRKVVMFLSLFCICSYLCCICFATLAGWWCGCLFLVSPVVSLF
jgi:DNA-directed RNA polymerase I subunit RPA2